MLSEELKQKELERLRRLYYERKNEFVKANRIRWILTLVCFAICNFIVLLFLFTRKGRADLSAIIEMIISSIVLALFHVFVNASVFGALFQKIIAQDRRLDDIMNQIKALEDMHNS